MLDFSEACWEVKYPLVRTKICVTLTVMLNEPEVSGFQITEVFQPQLSAAVAQMCPFRGHWPRAGGFRRLLKGRLRDMAKGKHKCELVSI